MCLEVCGFEEPTIGRGSARVIALTSATNLSACGSWCIFMALATQVSLEMWRLDHHRRQGHSSVCILQFSVIGAKVGGHNKHPTCFETF